MISRLCSAVLDHIVTTHVTFTLRRPPDRSQTQPPFHPCGGWIRQISRDNCIPHSAYISADHDDALLLARPVYTRSSAGFWLEGVNAPLPPKAKKIVKI